MITAKAFRDEAASGCIEEAGKYKYLLTYRKEQVDTMLRRWELARNLSYQEFLGILPDLEGLLRMRPDLSVSLLEMYDDMTGTIFASGTIDGWDFIEKHPVYFSRKHKPEKE